VRARIEVGIYLIQYFEWFIGEASTLALVRIEDMLNWQFYEDIEHMKFWYEHRYRKPDDAESGDTDARPPVTPPGPCRAPVVPPDPALCSHERWICYRKSLI
jgi:hypothetical protein